MLGNTKLTELEMLVKKTDPKHLQPGSRLSLKLQEAFSQDRSHTVEERQGLVISLVMSLPVWFWEVAFSVASFVSSAVILVSQHPPTSLFPLCPSSNVFYVREVAEVMAHAQHVRLTEVCFPTATSAG